MATEQAAKVPATATGANLAINQQSLTDVVGAKINTWLTEGAIVLPKNYSVDNAMKFAYLALQTVVDRDNKPALEVCTKDSIVNALLSMAVQGLNVGKNQAYFIVYNGKLQLQRSYFGTMALTMMVEPKIVDFAYSVVYQGDVFKYGIYLGKKTVTEHTQDIDNVHKDKIKAAYAIALNEAGEAFRTEIMTIEEIHQSWKQSKQNPFSDNGKLRAGTVHDKFTAAMCLRTVINKLCKPIINTSTDKVLLLDMIRKSEDLADRAAAEEEIEEHANTGEVIDIMTKPTAAPPENWNGKAPEQEAQDEAPHPTSVIEDYRTALHDAPDFITLNGLRKDIKDDPRLTDDDRATLASCYMAEAKRLKTPAGKQEQEQPAEERQPSF